MFEMLQKYFKVNFKIILIIVGIVFLWTYSTKIKQVLFVFDEKIGIFNIGDIDMFVCENYDDNNVFLSWSLPSTKLHSRIELYSGDTLLSSYRNKGKRILLNNQNKSYVLLNNLMNKNIYYSIYSIDRFGRYSQPKSVYCSSPNSNIEKLASGTFKYNYFDETINYLFYKLENENMKVLFARGVILGIENKKNNQLIFDTNFNFFNSYLTPMDIYGKKIVFSLYRNMYENDLSWLEIIKNNNSIFFIRHYLNSLKTKSIRYTLRNKTISIKYHSDFEDSNVVVRINFLGDNNFKSITKWNAKKVVSVISEPLKDRTKQLFINKQYSKNEELFYEHYDEVFNDDFPYINSRRFLKINEKTKFELYHNQNLIFSIFGATNDYFFYKNCTGEEGFTFGYKFPYMNGKFKIKTDFELNLQMEY